MDFDERIKSYKDEITKLEKEKNLMIQRSSELKENTCFKNTDEHLMYGQVFVYRKILKIISDNQIFEERMYFSLRKQYDKNNTVFEEPFIGRGTDFKTYILEACVPCSNEEYDAKKQFLLSKFQSNNILGELSEQQFPNEVSK